MRYNVHVSRTACLASDFNQLDPLPHTQNSHPLDLTKVQMQVVKANDKSAAQFIGGILKQRGAFRPGGI
jgi:hypothetical protein